jgi:hypothetical protein
VDKASAFEDSIEDGSRQVFVAQHLSPLVMIWAHLIKRFEAGLSLDTAKFGNIRLTTSTGMRGEAHTTRPATAANAAESDGKIRTPQNPFSRIAAPNSGHDNLH